MTPKTPLRPTSISGSRHGAPCSARSTSRQNRPRSTGCAELEALKPLLANNQYSDIAAILPGLLRDADALDRDGRFIKSRLLNVTGWIFTQTRQFGLAEPTLRQALDAADNRLDAASVANTLNWLYLRQGLLNDARQIATSWADEIEPRFSRATTAELTLWGRLLLGISNAAIRDNRPGEAEDAMNLARAVATRIGREALADTSTARTFGPVTVAMIHAENAAIAGKPDKVLAIAERIPPTTLNAHAASRNRHRLDVASALVATRKPIEAVGVLHDLGRVSPQWLRSQRYAKDILIRVTSRRRRLTPEMREVTDLITAIR